MGLTHTYEFDNSGQLRTVCMPGDNNNTENTNKALHGLYKTAAGEPKRREFVRKGQEGYSVEFIDENR